MGSETISFHAKRLQISEIRQKQSRSQFEIISKWLFFFHLKLKVEESFKILIAIKVSTLGDKLRNIFAQKNTVGRSVENGPLK